MNRCSSTLEAVSRRLTLSDVVSMRRSLGMAPSLPIEQSRWLLEETERLLRERARLEDALRKLRPPWSDVRAALNEVHRVLDGE